MRKQSLTVPWRDFARACDQLIEWKSFALWVRAIISSEQGAPPWLRECIDHRCPGFLDGRPKPSDYDSIWLDLSAWVDEHFFETAHHGGWLDALHFYSGRDPKSERIWCHWTRTEAAWCNSRPQTYPSFDEWHHEALKSCRTADRDELTPSPMADDQLAGLVRDYIEWEAFAFWARAIAESAAEIPANLTSVLEQRCPGFVDRIRMNRPQGTGFSTRVWRDLLGWIEDHFFASAKTSSSLDAVRATARTHLRGERIAAYWEDTNSRWSTRPPIRHPTFEEWLQEADGFIMR